MRNQTGKSGGDVVLVLLVDDEEHQRELTELSLVGADPALVITSTQTPSQALSLLLEQPFDCLVSDYQMPGMNGVELCAEVRKKSKIPFIIYTGRGSEEVASQAFAAGVDDYVRKEKDLAHYQVLARRIRQAAERHRISELYRVSVEANREGVSIIQGTEIVYANQAMADMLGEGGASDLIGRSITRWLVEEDKESVVRRALSRQGGRNEQGVFLYSVRRADGAVRILHASASIISYKGLPASIVFNHDDTEQRNTEDALRESGARLSALYSSMIEGVAQHEVVYDAGGAPVDYVITDVNPAYEQITGISRGEVRGKKASEIYGSGEAPFLEIYAQVAATGKPESFETYFPPMEKHINISSFSPGKGKFVTVFQDITERRMAEEEIKRANENLKSLNDFLSRSEEELAAANEALQSTNEELRMSQEELTVANESLQVKNEELQAVEAELRASNEELAMYSSSLEKMVNERTLGIKAASERLAAFINSASEGFSIYDSKLRIVDVNEAWLKRLPGGMTKSDVIGKHITDIYPGIEETPRYEEYLKVMKTGTPYNYEGYLAGDVVKRRYYFASVFKVGDGIGIVSRDATAHMELEREADETRRRLEAFMDSATEGFSLYDSELRLVDINRAVLNRFPKGTEEEDLIGKHITELYPGFEETEWYEAYKKVLETGTSWYGEGGGVGVMAGTYLSASAFKVGAGLGVVSRDISEQKRMEHEILEKGDRLQAFMESAMDEFFIYDENLTLLDLNKAALSPYPKGTKKSDLIGKRMEVNAPGVETTERYKGYLGVIRTGKPFTSYGEPSVSILGKWMHVTAFKVGEGLGIIARDITARVTMEKEIIEAKERLEAFKESVSDPFVIWSNDLNLIEANSAFLNWFPPGTRKRDLFGKNIKELAPGKEGRERYPVFLRVLETGEPAQLHNVPSLTGYGDRRYDVKIFKMGENIGILNADITEHMEADEKLYESSLYARSLIEASLDPLVTISAEGKITDVNEATVQATGVPRGNLIGSDFSDYFTDPERARTGYKQAFSEGFVKNYPLTIRHASGKLTEILYNATVYTNLVGEVTGVFAAARDVTEKNRLEKQLIRADRMDAVGKLTAMLAHDLRNPLNFIRQASDMALQEPERAERLLQLIGENAERSLRMIEDLRSGTKEISLQRASTNLTQLIAKTAEEIKMPDGVEMEIATGEGVENVEVDAGLMRRVLDNLVTNAVEAMPEGGRLAIRTSVGNGNVCIDVEDTGVGIPPEATPRIFDTFYSTKPKGLGLGLSFCRRAVEAHGGTLTFTSKKGTGTTFTVTLPKR